MIQPVASLLRALSFLSRFPALPQAFRGGPHPLAADAPSFPVVGLIVGFVPAVLLLLVMAAGLSPLTAAILALALMVASTGALHEDGLGDTADGLFGHAGKDRALDIMKDSRIGTYGVLALSFALLLRIALLAEMAMASPLAAACALLAAAAASRGGMGFLWSSLPSARPDGVADRLGRPTHRQGLWSLALGMAPGILLCWMASGLSGAVLAAAIATIVYLWFRSVVRRRLGGQTGDTLGACQQLLEIAILLGLALASG
ncbi:adenosylcobinamide-GDP ribazoletransferase [Aureimonas altamirensis]|uniref:adenosylcobinamide-GDP ribazoletransferase n=1 Tax=Aureimonas altamirensis TaxID=370622 RepID=UPI002036D305|nr:adenosylcobinamide-GDP ribazoletransferase [Aureimonas altamirensis]MCM2504049.1 adenosylcobinamide-GDP ribazoletransferase [Aureimonas altamirensis]